jgi:ArsR family transcriptional regulator, virulence genes transcriptional regulator
MEARTSKSDTRRSLPSADAMAAHAESAAELMKAMSHPVRLLVLCHLIDGEQSVGALLSRVSLSSSALSQHLAVLRENGLVHTRRESQTIYYSVAEGPALEVMQALYHSFCAPKLRKNAARDGG